MNFDLFSKKARSTQRRSPGIGIFQNSSCRTRHRFFRVTGSTEIKTGLPGSGSDSQEAVGGSEHVGFGFRFRLIQPGGLIDPVAKFMHTILGQ
jgi:hypothetical protein